MPNLYLATAALLLTPVAAIADKPLLIGVASNFKPVIDQLEADITPAINSTGQLVLQTLKGAPYDAVIVASTAAKDRLTSALPNASAHRLATGQLALACNQPSQLSQLDRLTVAIANPSTAPFGRAANQWLDSQQIAAGRLIKARSASQAFAYLKGGQVNCAITAASFVINQWPTQQWQRLATESADLEQWLVTLTPSTQVAPLINQINDTDLSQLGYDVAHD